mmetsp:Transcript_1540/g.2205  ORF Transcript_1540/g.2205 Transcript_1540/m.2205 type:complete len:204 (+) Transcript_1540:297-908(+)
MLTPSKVISRVLVPLAFRLCWRAAEMVVDGRAKKLGVMSSTTLSRVLSAHEMRWKTCPSLKGPTEVGWSEILLVYTRRHKPSHRWSIERLSGVATAIADSSWETRSSTRVISDLEAATPRSSEATARSNDNFNAGILSRSFTAEYIGLVSTDALIANLLGLELYDRGAAVKAIFLALFDDGQSLANVLDEYLVLTQCIWNTLE